MKVERKVYYKKNEKLQRLPFPVGTRIVSAEPMDNRDGFILCCEYPEDWAPCIGYPETEIALRITSRRLTKNDTQGAYSHLARAGIGRSGRWIYSGTGDRSRRDDIEFYELKHGDNHVQVREKHYVNINMPVRWKDGNWYLCARGDKRRGGVKRLVIFVDTREPNAQILETAARKMEALGLIVRLPVYDEPVHLLWVEMALLDSSV